MTFPCFGICVNLLLIFSFQLIKLTSLNLPTARALSLHSYIDIFKPKLKNVYLSLLSPHFINQDKCTCKWNLSSPNQILNVLKEIFFLQKSYDNFVKRITISQLILCNYLLTYYNCLKQDTNVLSFGLHRIITAALPSCSLIKLILKVFTYFP